MDKNIKFKNKTCNGWVLVNPKRLASENAKNIHIVEVKFKDNSDSIEHWSSSTYCEEKLIAEKNHIIGGIFQNTQEGRRALRLKVAELQNGGHEFCGNCAGHLYADPIA